MKESRFKCKYLKDNHSCINVLTENSECADVQIKDCAQKKAYYDSKIMRYPLTICRNCSKNGVLPLQLCEDFVSLKCVAKSIKERRNRMLGSLVATPKHKWKVYLAGIALANAKCDEDIRRHSELDLSEVDDSMLSALVISYKLLVWGVMYFCSASILWCILFSTIQRGCEDIFCYVFASLLIGFFLGGISVFTFAGCCSYSISSKSPYVRAYYEKLVPPPNIPLQAFLWILFLSLYTFLLFQKYIVK